MTFKLDGWPWKIIGHLFYTTLNLVHHFKNIVELKLELQSGNAQFGSKSAIFFLASDLEILWMTLKNNRAPLLCYVKLCASFQRPSVNSNWSYSPETLNSGQNRQFFVLCDLEIWPMTLKNNRAPLLCCIKLCALFHSHQWIQTKVTVRKRLIRVKIGNFCPVWPWNFMDDLEKQ